MSDSPAADARATELHDEEFHDDIIYPGTIAFVLVHLAAFGVIWTGFTTKAVILGVVLYLVRMFGATAGYHRYFSHRTYRTSRIGQFLLAFLAQTSLQKGVLWWSAQHRHHHRHSDTVHDVHSPRHHGLLFAHVGWIFAKKRGKADYSLVPDLMKFPELRLLNRFQHVPGVLLAIGCWAFAGLPGLFVGFFLSTVVLFHCTFAINSLAHTTGKQRYLTGDDSRNNWWLAIITLGEGWHNNHHRYQSSTRQGFHWWEFDPTYYALKALSWTGVIWDLRQPPPEVVRNEAHPGRKAIEKVARQLAASFPVEQIAQQVRDAWAQTPSLPSRAELVHRAEHARDQVAALLARVDLPHIPSLEDLRRRAEEMYADSPTLDEVVERAREILLQAVAARVVPELAADAAGG